MAEPRTLLVSKGRGEAVPMTVTQYIDMMRSLPIQARRLVSVRGNIPGVVPDQAGNLQRQQLSHEEVAARMDRGQDPVIRPKDPRLDILRQQDALEARNEYADDANMLFGITKVAPFISQKLQNAAVGPEAAAQARMEMAQANQGLGLGLDLAMLATLGAGAGAAARTFFPGMAAGLGTTTGVRGFANLMGAGLAADTYLYGTYLWDTNTPFKAEDYARHVLTGALINLPLAGAAAVRGAAVRGVGRALERGGNAADTAANFLTTKGLLEPFGSRGANSAFRQAAVFRMVSRFGRKLQGKKVAVEMLDPVADAERAASQMQKTIAKVTPQQLAKMTREQRTALLNEVRGWADVVDDFGTINFETLPDKLKQAQKTADRVYKEIDKLNVNTGDWTYGIGGKASKKQKAAYVSAMEEMLGKLDDAGWKDISGNLEELLRFDKDGALIGNPHENFGRFVQARLDAKLKAGSVGGAAEAEKALESIINNTNIWGTGKAVELGPKLNRAIDDLADAQLSLRKLAETRKNIHDIHAGDSALVQNVHREMDKMLEAYRALRDARMVGEGTIKSVKKLVKEITDDLTNSLPAYQGASKINALRGKAAGTTTERLGRVHQAAPDFEARMRQSIAEDAERVLAVHKGLLKALKTGSDIAAATSIGGVVLLRRMSREEKDVVFNHLQDEIPALTGSPERMQDVFQQIMEGSVTADADLTALGGVQAATAIYYLQSKLPPKRVNMYGNNEVPRLQKEAFLQAYAAIMDPVSVLYAAAEGRVTPNMLEAIRVTQPAMYAELSNAAIDALTQVNPAKAKRKTLTGLNAFLGGLNPLYRGEALMRLQQNWTQNEQQNQAINGPGGIQPMPMEHTFDTPDTTDRGNQFTYTQRLASY